MNRSGVEEVEWLRVQLKDKLKLRDLDDKVRVDIQTLLNVLQSPVFEKIVTIEDSLDQLKSQLQQHPSILPADFDISTKSGQLLITAPASDATTNGCKTGDHRFKTFTAVPSEDPAYANTKCKPTISPKPRSSSSLDSMVLNSEWVQVESVLLPNDSNGLGFGIVGGKSTGVVVKTLVSGGIADRDRRMRVGDHILAIGDVSLRGMTSEQVAHVLRSQSAPKVRMILARAIDPQAVTTDDTPGCAIIPTRLLPDMAEVRRRLALAAAIQSPQPLPVPPPGFEDEIPGPILLETPSPVTARRTGDISHEMALTKQAVEVDESLSIILPPPDQFPPEDVTGPEMETFDVTLLKDHQGLGITIAGYVCEKEEISGIFVKSIAPGSAADCSRKIAINDQIIEVDGKSLYGHTNHQAVEVLRKSGVCVNLRLARYLRGAKFNQLQQLVAAADVSSSVTHHYPPPAKPTVDSSTPSKTPGSTLIQLENNSNQRRSSLESSNSIAPPQDFDSDSDFPPPPLPLPVSLPAAPQTTTVTIRESAETIHMRSLQSKWYQRLGSDFLIVVSRIEKFRESGGLGISLEGTVDLEDGREARSHHFIRAILSEGPVGMEGSLRAGDEILEVNGRELIFMNHKDVVALLKELPRNVEMVCARSRPSAKFSANIINNNNVNIHNKNNLISSEAVRWDQGKAGQEKGQNRVQHSLSDRLVKAKSDGSLAIGIGSGSVGPALTLTDDASRIRSRSLEPLTGLAMWSFEPLLIQLPKGERGLGFSILDYQDPLNPSETVIVVRSLVPGGVAQLDGRLVPGDRLISVNGINLEHATLDEAVQALKGASRGIVEIAVCKPLPLPLPDYDAASATIRLHSDQLTSSNKL